MAPRRAQEGQLAQLLEGQALVALGRDAEAVAAFDEYLAGGGSPSADCYRGRGLARLRLGRYAESAADLSRALDLRPDAELHLQRGWAYFFLDAWQLAGRDFEEAIRLGSPQPDAWTGRALTRVLLGAVGAGVADVEEVIQRNPPTPQTWHNVACVFALAASRTGRESALSDRYRARSVEAVRRTLALVPEKDRAAFWRDKIAPDRALDAIRGTEDFRTWERQFRRGRPAGPPGGAGADGGA